MRKTFLLLPGLALIGGLLASCHKDVDLNNVDTKAEVEMGIGLPVGTVSATMGDFLGNGQVKGIYVEKNDDDRFFYYHDTISIPTKHFHPLDISSYYLTSPDAKTINLKSLLGEKIISGPTGVYKEVTFPIYVDASVFNANPTIERTDSIAINFAQFSSFLGFSDIDLQWSDIKCIKLTLGKDFNCTNGSGKDIYFDPTTVGKDQEMVGRASNFIINFLKDRNNPKGDHISNLDMTVTVGIQIPANKTIQLTDASAMRCYLYMCNMSYSAAWGFFHACNDMIDKDSYLIDSLWEDWKEIKKAKIRVLEPQITVSATHRIAAPLVCNIKSLWAYSIQENKRVQATWNGSTTHTETLKDVLDPVHSGLNDSIEHSITFSHETAAGHIDELLDIRPDSFGYDFELIEDRNRDAQYPQYRILANTDLSSQADIYAPFVLKEGSEAAYNLTFKDVNISGFSLDSLLKKSDTTQYAIINRADIRLVMTAENSIPFDIIASFKFKDEAGQIIDIHPIEGETFKIAAPTKYGSDTHGKYSYAVVREPMKSIVTISFSDEDWEKFTKSKTIEMYAELSGNAKTACFTDGTQLKAHLGLATMVDVISDLKNFEVESK